MNGNPTMGAAIAAPHAVPAHAIIAALDTDPAVGLSEPEAEARLARFGPNELLGHEPPGALSILMDQIASPVVALLAAAAAISFYFQDWAEAAAVLVVLAINTAIGFVTESRAQRSMEALRRLGAQRQRVRRGARERIVPAGELVPGDVVLVGEGDVVAADIRLLGTRGLEADESTLTGESVPVGKSVVPVAEAAPLADRPSMLFKGTAVTRGDGEGVVTSTGFATELGHIALLAGTAEPEESPLTRRLAELSAGLVLIVLVIAASLGAIGIMEHQDPLLMIKAAISLAVAAIPEGLPIVATLVLARGMLRLADRHAIIERLPAVETLGATTVILTDKTGTLTENRMTVARLAIPSGDIDLRKGLAGDGSANSTLRQEANQLLTAGALCNGASLGAEGKEQSGDPMELALLTAARRFGLERSDLELRMPECERVAFDSAAKFMATVHRNAGALLIAVKGAPEVILERCRRVGAGEGEALLDESLRSAWLERARSLGNEGLRVLAFARAEAREFRGEIGNDLTLLGLAALEDPPRAGVREAIAACRSAGIEVVMVTGDHAGTAAAIAKAVGFGPGPITVVEGRDLESENAVASLPERGVEVLARVTPRQKLELVEAYQRAGHIVAMTGDGVNDAPALKKADIGIAMGRRGTEIARQAAVMVLTDDAFPTIVEAVRQGRVIFSNVRRFIVYLLSCNLSEVLVVSLAILAGLPLPLQPIQILFMNVVTDVFPALALAMGEGDGHVLERPPRDPREPIIAKRHWVRIVAFSAVITSFTLGAMLLALEWEGVDRGTATTISFLTLALTQLWFAFNMTDTGEGLIVSNVVKNAYVWGALLLCILMLVAALTIAPLSHALDIATPDATGLAIAGGASLGALLVGAAVLSVLRASPLFSQG